MNPEYYGMGFGALLTSMSLLGFPLREKKPRTDLDRLRDLDIAETKYIAKITNPSYIAAQNKRERKRNKLKEIKND